VPSSTRKSASIAAAPAATASYLAVVAAALVILFAPGFEPADGAAFDFTAKLVREFALRPAPDEIVIVGIDEASEQALAEPFAMWHAHLGNALAVIARAAPAAVALDIALPDRSFDTIQPGLDEALVRGIVAARQAAPLVVGLSLDAQGRPRHVHPLLVAAAGEQSFGLAYTPVDRDGVARRYSPMLGESDAGLPNLAERTVLALGGKAASAGWVDFAFGAPFQYVPLTEVLRWQNDADAARRVLAGKIVLLGSVLPDVDRVRQPLSLAAWEPQAAAPPGVLMQAQTVRALRGGAILKSLPTAGVLALAALAALLTFIAGAGRAWLAAALTITALAGATYMAYRAGWFLRPAAPMAAALLAATVASLRQAIEQQRARAAIERRFAGYVSPNVLAGLLSGEIDISAARKSPDLSFLFADIRGFSALSERLPAEQVVALLNRYYEAMTAAIHGAGGMIDNFRGDGLMAVFGAPDRLPDPTGRALAAARDMFVRLAALNAQLIQERREPLAIGIGVASGEAVLGNIGSAERHDFTAIGDAVNVAARLQSLCKERSMRLIVSGEVARRAPKDMPFVALGLVEIAGHTPVEAFGLPANEAAEDSANPMPNLRLSTELDSP
jgi:adenylate cyclase